jgi:dTDP-4-amino-4,6-dideoxygalactose transaminase
VCFGGYSGGGTPGYIPNPEAKPVSADGTAGGTLWESRTPPNNLCRELCRKLRFPTKLFFVGPQVTWCSHCLGSMPPMGTADELTSELTRSGVRPGNEVIVSAYDTPEAAEAVLLAGARPVFVDIDARTFCMDPAAVAQAMTARTAAVLPVHTFGHPADLARLTEVAGPHGVLVMECRTVPGPAKETARRQANAAYLTARLRGLTTPAAAPGVEHTYEQYVVRVPGNGRPDRDAFARALRYRGVMCHVPVQTPVHRARRFQHGGWLAETERAADEGLALPIDAAMSRRELQQVVSACNALGGVLQSAA